MAEKTKNKEIMLCGRRVAYVLKSGGRRRNLRITVKPGGMVAVAKPGFVSEHAVEDFLVKKSAWVIKVLDRMGRRKNLLAGGKRADYKRLAETARELVRQRLIFFNKKYNLKFGRVAIRDQRTRWGSCSRKGNLNFNYRITLLPPRLADYIVVHEMCHLAELNHSAKFWRLVARALPDFGDRRRELRQNY
jgi:predicted metal-dependent hydrolase